MRCNSQSEICILYIPNLFFTYLSSIFTIQNSITMTQIVLEIDNDKDIRLFLDLAERLNIRFRTSFSQIRKAKKVNDLTSNELHNIIQDGKGLAFLEDEAENIYTDDNLKVKF